MNINPLTVFGSITMAVAIAGGTVLPIGATGPDPIDLVSEPQPTSVESVPDVTPDNFATDELPARLGDLETNGSCQASKPEAQKRVDANPATTQQEPVNVHPAPTDHHGSPTPPADPAPPAEEPAPPDNGETGDVPADCDVIFYPELYVSTPLEAGSVVNASQFTAKPGETVAFGQPLVLAGDTVETIIVFSGMGHMTGRQVRSDDILFFPALTESVDVTLGFVGTLNDAKYRIDLTVNSIESGTIEITNVRFTHRQCGAMIVHPRPADDVLVDHITNGL